MEKALRGVAGIRHAGADRTWRAEGGVTPVFILSGATTARYDAALGAGRSWMFAIVRNRAINALRDTSRERAAPEEEIVAAIDRGNEGDNVFDRLAVGSALRRCLEQLDPRRRTGVLLAYVEGLSHGEIAAKLGVPLGTAKSWITRSLAQLKECLA